MANNDIKQKIVLEGEKQYRDAIKDAQRNLKTLRSELKAETAELGSNASAQEKNEAKVKSLKKQIQEQEKIVKANRDALEEVKQKYGDNADAIAKYEQKLNDSRTALANMKNELDGVGKGFKGIETDASMATVATKSVGDSLSNLSSIGESVSSSIEGIFTGMLNTVKETVALIWGEVLNIAAKANNWTDTASYLGSTPEEVQMWDRAVTAAQGDFNQLTAAITKLKYGGKNQDIAEWFGLSDVNYTDDLEYTTQLLGMMAKQKEDMVKAGTWDSAMAAIFGKKMPKEVEWFINNWDTIQQNLGTFNAEEGGYGLTGEELQTANDLYIKIGEIQEKWNALKESFTMKLFGGLALDITTNASELLDAFKAYFDADNDADREAALKLIEDNILKIFNRIADAIRTGIDIINQVAEDLKNSDDPTAQTVGTIMETLAGALKWFTEDNMNNVIKALEILAAFWAVGKGFQLVTTIASFVKDLKVIQGFNMSNIGMGIGDSAASSFASKLSTVLPGMILAAVVAAPIADAIANPDKYKKPIYTDKKAQETLDKIVEETGGTTGAITRGDLWSMPGLGTVINGGKKGTSEEDLGFLIPTIRTPNGRISGFNVTDEQRESIERYWDYTREQNWADKTAELDRLQDLFADDAETLNSLLELVAREFENGGGGEDTPAAWWPHLVEGGNSGSTDGLTGTDAKNMTQAVNSLPGEFSKRLNNVRIYMDRTVVGQMVADEVSRQIALNTLV